MKAHNKSHVKHGLASNGQAEAIGLPLERLGGGTRP